MKRKFFRAALAGVATTGVVASSLLAFASPSYAGGYTAPPWEPDAYQNTGGASGYGSLVFYDANGDQITSGTNLANPWAYIAGTTPFPQASAVQVTGVYFALPNPANPTASWTSAKEASSTSPTLPGTAPTDLQALDSTYPVLAPAGADLSTYITSVGAGFSTATGYANLIQVRLVPKDSVSKATGPYYESDIAFNTGSSAITVAGNVNVPADGWAEVYPDATQVVPTLSTTLSSPVTTSSAVSVPLTATLPSADASAAGSVNFYQGTTLLANVAVSGGSASYTATSPTYPGSSSFNAIFVPGNTTAGPGDETGLTASPAAAAILADDTPSNTVTVSEEPPLTGTTTKISANPTSIAYQASTTLTATVTEADSGSAGITGGSVNFYDGGSVSGGVYTPGTSLGAGSYSVTGTTGTATLATTALPSGTDDVYAVFTPASGEQSSYAGSFSVTPVPVTVAAPATCNATSTCPDTQNITVTLSPGTLTITTPYTASNPFVLPNLALSSDGTYLESSATFPSANATTGSTTVTTAPSNPDVQDLANATLAVASTASFGPQGTITVVTSSGTAQLIYTGVTSTSFTGVSYSAGDGNIAAGAAVTGPELGAIVVTSDLAPAANWTVTVAASNLTGSAGTIQSTGLGLTGGTLDNATGTGAYPGTVTFTNIPALNPSPVDGAGTGPGLKATPQTWATSAGATATPTTPVDGTALLSGTLTLLAPTSTSAGTYTGTITFTAS